MVYSVAWDEGKGEGGPATRKGLAPAPAIMGESCVCCFDLLVVSKLLRVLVSKKKKSLVRGHGDRSSTRRIKGFSADVADVADVAKGG